MITMLCVILIAWIFPIGPMLWCVYIQSARNLSEDAACEQELQDAGKGYVLATVLGGPFAWLWWLFVQGCASPRKFFAPEWDRLKTKPKQVA
jgi:hypothetical protein